MFAGRSDGILPRPRKQPTGLICAPLRRGRAVRTLVTPRQKSRLYRDTVQTAFCVSVIKKIPCFESEKLTLKQKAHCKSTWQCAFWCARRNSPSRALETPHRGVSASWDAKRGARAVRIRSFICQRMLKSKEASSRRYCSARRGPQLAEPMPFCA